MLVNRGRLFFPLEHPEAGHIDAFTLEQGLCDESAYGHTLLHDGSDGLEERCGKIRVRAVGLPAIAESEIEDVGFVRVMLPVFRVSTEVPDA